LTPAAPLSALTVAALTQPSADVGGPGDRAWSAYAATAAAATAPEPQLVLDLYAAPLRTLVSAAGGGDDCSDEGALNEKSAAAAASLLVAVSQTARRRWCAARRRAAAEPHQPAGEDVADLAEVRREVKRLLQGQPRICPQVYAWAKRNPQHVEIVREFWGPHRRNRNAPKPFSNQEIPKSFLDNLEYPLYEKTLFCIRRATIRGAGGLILLPDGCVSHQTTWAPEQITSSPI
jgi:hypothetical protein